MTSPNATPTPITPPRVPLTDERTGLIAREWYLFFLSLFRAAANADDGLLGPQVQDTSGQLEQVYEAAQLAALFNARLSEIDKRLDGIECLPPPPQVRLPRYGTFYDTTTQTAAAINTAYAITFNTTDLSFGVTRGTTTSRIYVDTPSIYDFQFSIQLDNTSGGNHLAYIWARVNGTDVAQSASQVRLKGNDGELVAAWNFVLSLNAGDYFELMWSVSDTAVQILALAAAAPVPAIPSVLLTVTNNIKG
jgi:hypothetical protein